VKRFKPYKYVKDESFDPFYKEVNWKFFARTSVIPIFFVATGFFVLISQIILPIYVFETSDIVSRPVSQSVLGTAAGFGDFSFEELGQSEDSSLQKDSLQGFFQISIPKVGIKNAAVEINSPTLSPDRALGHYTGTALPGEIGTMFIYGHSVLPMFYNPRNYKTIFSTLGDLEVGDTITVAYENRDYVYKVESKVVVDPELVNPRAELKPAYLNERSIVLMTCWPAGTKSKRLLVNAVEAD
jgi:LPXTG-site transpeptidase (sortase) family protein